MSDAPPSVVADDTLAGGGELGVLMRAYDWASSPLGPVEAWPQSLKTCVRIMLTSRQPMWLGWGEQLTVLYNDPYKAIIGGKHPWALGMPTAEIWHEIWDEIGPRIRTTLEGGEGTFDEGLLLIMERHGYPEETYFTFSYSPVPNDRGGVGGLFCANSDDTKRIIGERQLALLRELATSTANVRTIMDACLRSARALETDPHDLPFALVYLVQTDSSGQRSAVLAGAATIENGHPAAPDVIQLDDHGGAARWPLAEVLATGEARMVPDLAAIYAGDMPLPTGAWNIPPREAVVIPIAASGDTGQAGFLVAALNPYRIFNDGYRSFLGLVAGQIAAAIGSAQTYEEERRRAEMLAELDRAKTVFFSNVSHEFRTPLTLLLGPLEDGLTDMAHPLPPVHRERQEAAQRNARRLLRLVNSLLDFSRIEAGREQVAFAATDLPAYTAELASTFRSAIEQAGLRLVIACPPLSEPAYVDQEMWEKIVLNLLSNALKFTFDGEIGVAVRPAGDTLELTVWDTGVGIAPDELPRLFERFHRVQGTRARTHESTGIGLALVQELVRLHGGTIRVQSEPNRGTTFTVSIPAGSRHLPTDRLADPSSMRPALTDATPFLDEALSWLPERDTLTETPITRRDAAAGDLCLLTEPNRAPPDASGQRTGRPRVLVADDNRDMRDYVVRLLRQHYDVEAVADGEAALAAALDRPPCLILSDVMMPRRDGFELVTGLRADRRTRDVPVILLSARAGEEASADGMRSGADDYLVKPFSARELLSRVEARIALAGARAEAEAERARLRILFEQAPAAVCLLSGPEHVFTLANPAYRELIGRDDVLGKRVQEVLPGLAGQGILELLDRVYQRAEVYVGNEVLVHEDWNGDGLAEDAYFNFVYAPVLKTDGTVEGIFVHAYQVTDQVHARQEAERLARELAHERDRVEQVLTSIHDAFVTVDRDWHFTYVNDQAVELLGQPRETLLGGSVWDIYPEAVGSESYQLLHDAAEQRRAVHYEEFNVGRHRWYESRAYPTEDGLAILFSDITERKLAEYRVREGEERLRVALAGAQISVFTQDRACRYTWIYNPLPEFTPEGIVGATDADHMAPEEADYLHALKRRVMESGQGAREVVKSTSRAGVRFHDLIIEPLRDADGAIIGVIGSALDVTERQMLERAQNEFLAMASHELRNPLASVRGFAQLMQRRQQYSERAIDAILGQTRQLERLTGDLLDITRATAGRLELQRCDVNLTTIAQAAVDEAQATTSAHRVRLLAPSEPVRGRWDADRLGQILRNLLSNAIKYAPGGGDVLVHLRATPDGASVAVTDHGRGIPAAALPRLFDRFYRVGQVAGQASGLGLGLAITKTLVDAHGGRIEVESVSGQGSTFTVFLPYDRDGGDAPPEAAEPHGVTTLRVLVVDDDPQIRAILEQTLLDEGYEVVLAADGREALERVQERRPGLILLDVMMPVMDGSAFVQELDQRQLRADIPLVLISAAGRLGHSAAQLGAVASLEKPFDLTALAELVGGVARRHSAR